MHTASFLLLGLLLQATPRELVELLRSDRAEVRQKAFDQLKRLGPEALPDLQAAVQDSDAEVSRRASAAIRVIAMRESISPALRKAMPGVEDRLAGAPDAVFTQVLLEGADHFDLRSVDLNPLAAAALRGARGNELRSVYNAVLRLKLTAAIPEIIRQIRTPDTEIGWTACDTLIRLDPPAAKAAFLQTLADPSEEVLRRCLTSLGFLDAPDAIPKIAEFLTHDTESVRECAAKALGSLHAVEMVPRLLPLLEDRNLPVQDAAAKSLGRLATPDLAPALLELLKSRNPLAHRAPIWVLSRLHIPRAAPEFAKELKSTDPVSRSLAVWGLIDLQAKEYGPDIVPLLGDEEVQVRTAAIWAVTQFGLREAGPAIVAALDSKDSDLTLYAAWAAGRMGLPDAIPGLLAVFKDPDHDATATAALALGQLRAKAALPHLRELAAVRGAVGRNAARAVAMIEDRPPTAMLLALVNSGNDDIPRVFRNSLRAKPVPELAPEILKLLESPDDETRLRAARRAGELRLAETGPALLKLLRHPDPSDPIQPIVALSLGELRVTEAMPEFVRLATDEKTPDRDAIITALSLLETPESLAELRSLAKSKNSGVRWPALRSLADRGHRDVLPEIADLVKSQDPDNGWIASAWLCRFGRGDGVEQLLPVPAFRASINAVRNPAVWKKLVDVSYKADLEGTFYEIAAKIAADAGLRLDWAWDDVWDIETAFDPKRVLVDERPITAADALEQLLVDSMEPYGVLLEDGVLRIVHADVEKRVLTRWWRSTQKR